MVGSIRLPDTSVHVRVLILRIREACPGLRMVNRIPCCAMISRVSRSTAVSGSHMPSGGRSKWL